jgi:hypothetical protein
MAVLEQVDATVSAIVMSELEHLQKLGLDVVDHRVHVLQVEALLPLGMVGEVEGDVGVGGGQGLEVLGGIAASTISRCSDHTKEAVPLKEYLHQGSD